MGKLWHLGFDIIVQPWFPQYGIECQDIENENEIQKQNYEIHLYLDFTQSRIFMIYIDKERHLHDYSKWLVFFQEDVGSMFGWASLGRWTTTDGGISICQVVIIL